MVLILNAEMKQLTWLKLRLSLQNTCGKLGETLADTMVYYIGLYSGIENIGKLDIVLPNCVLLSLLVILLSRRCAVGPASQEEGYKGSCASCKCD